MIEIVSGGHRRVSQPDFSRLSEGYTPAGPQDRYSCRMTNRLLGNRDDEEAIEFTLAPAKFRVTSTCRIAVGGAPCEITVNDSPVADWTVIEVAAGSTVQIKIGQTGCRVYVGIAKHFDKALVGRTRSEINTAWEPKLGTLRILPGPEATDAALSQLTTTTWEVGCQSSGMGLRLIGEPLQLERYDITSSPVQDGTIQATKNGLLALLRQRGTLGGYPRVATVIDSDVDRLAQFRPESRVKLEVVSQDRARELYRLQMRT